MTVRWLLMTGGPDALAQFPMENEILFAPLTGLEVTSEPWLEGNTIMISLRISTNTRDLTSAWSSGAELATFTSRCLCPLPWHLTAMAPHCHGTSLPLLTCCARISGVF